MNGRNFRLPSASWPSRRLNLTSDNPDSSPYAGLLWPFATMSNSGVKTHSCVSITFFSS